MGDDDTQSQPQPFDRRRNLSSRNFEKQGFRRRPSTASNNSRQESFETSDNSSSSSSFQLSYSVNSDTENGFREKSLRKIRIDPSQSDTAPPQASEERPFPVASPRPPSTASTPDPALLDVRQKVKRFEFLVQEEKTSSPTAPPVVARKVSFHDKEQGDFVSASNPVLASTRYSGFNESIDEERTEDDVDNFSSSDDELHVPNRADEVFEDNNDNVTPTPETEIVVQRPPKVPTKHFQPISLQIPDGTKTVGRDFIRNYSAKNIPRNQVLLAIPKNRTPDKSQSVYHEAEDAEDEEEAELRNKNVFDVEKILEELIQTERNYVQNLTMNLDRYGKLFERIDLPDGLRGKKYDLFGNIEQIVEFHRDEFLPMLERNSRDLKMIFDQFTRYIDENCFYCYVLYTMNKKTSLKLFDTYVKYFKLIENEINDPLGINSFLVEPIQRMPRYSLLLEAFMKKLFETKDFTLKPVLSSCCTLDKKLRNLLHKVNNAEVVNDIVNCHEVDIRLQGKFTKVDEFTVSDHSLKRSYRSKVFMFDKCIIYTEIKDSQLIFRGRYPCELVGIDPKIKHLTLYIEKRKKQECEFHADPKVIENWIELIREMISAYLKEERLKIKELYTNKGDHMHRKPPSLALFRDSNRFSSDSGIGNIWVLPKPEIDESISNNRTTWYTDR